MIYCYNVKVSVGGHILTLTLVKESVVQALTHAVKYGKLESYKRLPYTGLLFQNQA